MRTLVALLLLGTTAQAADHAMMLNDQEIAAMSAIFDAAIRQSGLSNVSRNAIILNDKMVNAPVVTAQKPPTPDPTPPPSAPTQDKDHE